MEKSCYIWTYDGSHAKAAEIAATGATVAWLKAGGDGGITWIPDPTPERWENEQWDDAYLAPLTSRGIECRPWFYNHLGDADKESVLTALAHRWSDDIALNPEVEWRVQHAESPYTNLTAGNSFAWTWVTDLIGRCLERFNKAPRIWFSSCPSWGDFPYEGYAAACHGAHPQHYWHDALMARGENQVEAHYRRAGAALPCVPILTACREYDDAGVLALAHSALLHPIDGFSAWEAGNRSYQADAMRRAYLLLPADSTPPAATLDPVAALARLVANLGG
jgi:hypothetical protein